MLFKGDLAGNSALTGDGAKRPPFRGDRVPSQQLLFPNTNFLAYQGNLALSGLLAVRR